MVQAVLAVRARKTVALVVSSPFISRGSRHMTATIQARLDKEALDGFMLMITQSGLPWAQHGRPPHPREQHLQHRRQAGPPHPARAPGEEEGGNEQPKSSVKARQQIFLCRIHMSLNARRQMRFRDQKVILVKGHFYSSLPLCSRDEPVFAAHCSPLAMPENRNIVVQRTTNAFTTGHSRDMKTIELDNTSTPRHLGYRRHELAGVSFHHRLHPDSMRELQAKPRLVTSSDSDKSSILPLRLQTMSGGYLWVHTVLQLKDGVEEGAAPVIILTNQILSTEEAAVMKANSWLYHYYMVQSRLQYGLAYGAPPALGALHYPHMHTSPWETHRPPRLLPAVLPLPEERHLLLPRLPAKQL